MNDPVREHAKQTKEQSHHGPHKGTEQEQAPPRFALVARVVMDGKRKNQVDQEEREPQENRHAQKRGFDNGESQRDGSAHISWSTVLVLWFIGRDVHR